MELIFEESEDQGFFPIFFRDKQKSLQFVVIDSKLFELKRVNRILKPKEGPSWNLVEIPIK